MQNNDRWGTRIGLILAMAGNAVGLGNFLRFPVQAIQNGGGAFIIPYLVCFVLLGIPMLWVEWAMGRFGGVEGYRNTPFILQSLDPKRGFWKYLGALGLFVNIAVAAYYCYVESWALGYTYHAIFGTFSGMKPEEVSHFFDTYVGLETHIMGLPIPVAIFFWLICLWLNIWILSKGLKEGVEAAAKIAMPLLILFGILLAIKAVSLQAGGSSGAVYSGVSGLEFLWKPDFSTIWSPRVWLAAAGQIFFTLSVGMGSIQCYASYLSSKDDIALNAMAAGWMNEFVEVVIGGAIIIPIAIGYFGVEGVNALIQKVGGLGLGFRTLPYLFQQWGPFFAAFAGFMWFMLLFFAGITSSLAMGLPITGFLQDEFDISQKKGAWIFGATVCVLGLPTIFFFNYGVFDEFDYWAGTVSLVVFGVLEVILFAWIFGMEKGWTEINKGSDIQVPLLFKYIIQYITPLLLLIVFITSIINPMPQEGRIVYHYTHIPADTVTKYDTVKGKPIVRTKITPADTLVEKDTLRNVNDWVIAFDSLRAGAGWQFDHYSIVGKITHQQEVIALQSLQDSLSYLQKKFSKAKTRSEQAISLSHRIEEKHKQVQFLRAKRRYTNASRALLFTLLGAICFAVHLAYKRRLAANEAESL